MSGAAAVKEMFNGDGSLEGWAFMVKIHAASDEGRGWFWYEVTGQATAPIVVASGNGVEGCVSCHSFGGKDLLLSGHPL